MKLHHFAVANTDNRKDVKIIFKKLKCFDIEIYILDIIFTGNLITFTRLQINYEILFFIFKLILLIRYF